MVGYRRFSKSQIGHTLASRNLWMLQASRARGLSTRRLASLQTPIQDRQVSVKVADDSLMS
jgi:hypothetical protein